MGWSEGACYRCSFFLRLFLKEEHGIDGKAVVGFVNDGTDHAYASHAWYEFAGTRTDLALWRPLRPDVQRPGPLVVQGVELRPGHRWSYHRERPAEGMALVFSLLQPSSPHMSAVRELEERHRTMSACAGRDDLIRAYLDGAPDGWLYERMAGFVRAGGGTA